MAEILRVENLQVRFETAVGQVKAINDVSFSRMRSRSIAWWEKVERVRAPWRWQ